MCSRVGCSTLKLALHDHINPAKHLYSFKDWLNKGNKVILDNNFFKNVKAPVLHLSRFLHAPIECQLTICT